MSVAARVGAEAIRCGTFWHRNCNRTKGIPKTIGFGGVLSPISSAAGRNGAAGGAEPRGRGRTPPLCGCPEFYSFRGPAGRTHTCRKRRQVRVLIIAQTEGRLLLSACHVSGSEGRRRGDSLRNLFVPQLQSDERNSKNHWFLAAFFPPFLPLLEEMGPPEAQSREGGGEPRPYADVRNFIVSAAQRAAPTLAAAGGRCAIW